jgi:hypothetical protein
MAALKTNDPDFLTRGMESLRAKHNVRHELKFSELTRGSISFFQGLIELIHDSGSEIGAAVIDKRLYDPFPDKPLWEAHSWTTAALVKGMTNRRELATLLVDGISTPADVAYGSRLRTSVNERFKSMRVVSAVSLDSRTCDGLQAADMVASAIAHDRKTVNEFGRDHYSRLTTPKAQIAKYLARRFDLGDFEDIRTGKVNIRTIAHQPKTQLPGVAEMLDGGA